MSKKLDKTRPFAQIFGDRERRAFEQDGTFFHADGSEWIDPSAVKPAVSKSVAKRVMVQAVQPVQAVAPAEDSQLNAQLAG